MKGEKYCCSLTAANGRQSLRGICQRRRISQLSDSYLRWQLTRWKSQSQSSLWISCTITFALPQEKDMFGYFMVWKERNLLAIVHQHFAAMSVVPDGIRSILQDFPWGMLQ